MTREEAKELPFVDTMHGLVHEKNLIVDKIYDHFEQQLKELNAYNSELALALDASNIPRNMSEGTDNRIRSLAQQVQVLQEQLKEKDEALAEHTRIENSFIYRIKQLEAELLSSESILFERIDKLESELEHLRSKRKG